MQLDDNLKVCLLALESRFPIHVIDFNESVMHSPPSGPRGWSTQEIIHYYERAGPDILQAMARLVVTPQKSEIYLVEQIDQPALVVYCQGRLPCRCHRETGATDKMEKVTS